MFDLVVSVAIKRLLQNSMPNVAGRSPRKGLARSTGSQPDHYPQRGNDLTRRKFDVTSCGIAGPRLRVLQQPLNGDATDSLPVLMRCQVRAPTAEIWQEQHEPPSGIRRGFCVTGHPGFRGAQWVRYRLAGFRRTARPARPAIPAIMLPSSNQASLPSGPLPVFGKVVTGTEGVGGCGRGWCHEK